MLVFLCKKMEEVEKGYLTVTTSRPPSSNSLSESSNFPFACILKPFIHSESDIPTVSFPTKELIRCFQCQGYISPYCDFVESGCRWVCSLCKTINPIPSEYFAALDANGKRTDIEKRPELTHLSIDIVAPESYMSRPPMPCIYAILIDLSIKAQENEYISLIISTLCDMIASQALPGYPRTEVCLIFFDKSVHFVNLRSENPVFYTECDSTDLFLPVPIGELLVNIDEIEDNLLKALELSKSMISLPYSTCYFAALRAAGLVLENQGGKIVSFCGEMFIDTSHPLEFTFKPNTLLFQDLGKEFSQMNISCTQFVRTSQYCNLQVLIDLSKFSSGQVFFYPHYNHRISGEKLRNEVIMAFTGLTVWESSVKTRVSNEWSIVAQYGNCTERTTKGLLGISVYNFPQCYVYELIPNSVSFSEIFRQSAILYTNCEGERKLRVHNLKLTTTDNLRDVLENANCNVLVNVLAKKALQQIIQTNIPKSGSVYLESRCRDIVKACCRIWGKQPPRLEFFCASILGLLKQYVFMNDSYGCKL